MQEVSKSTQLQKAHPIQITNLKCINNNKASLLCSTKGCQLKAFLCRSEQCECIPQNHRRCDLTLTNYIVETILAKKTAPSQEIQKSIDKINQIYQQAIDQLSLKRQELNQWKDNFGLTVNQANFMKHINQNQLQKVTGDSVYHLKINLDFKQDLSWLNQDWVQNFWKREKKNFNKVFATLNKLNHPTRIKHALIDSKIIFQSTNLLDFFGQQKGSNINQLKLLYRASQNEFSTQKFKQKCSNIPHTIVLIETEYGKIIGGYAAQCWNSNSQQYVPDQSLQSFIFSISLNKKFKLNDKANSIKNVSSSGPIFGGSGGWDISISDKSNENTSSFFNFPSKYGNNQYQNSQNSWTDFCGASSGYHAKIKQWEVYQIKWHDEKINQEIKKI